MSYDVLLEFEKYINKKLKTGTRKIKVVFLPVPRDKLLPWLIEGRGDIAMANLTITDERRKSVDFSRLEILADYVLPHSGRLQFQSRFKVHT